MSRAIVFSALFATVVATAPLAGCKKDEVGPEKGAPPPSSAAGLPGVTVTKAGACASGGGVVNDQVSQSYFPRVVGGYCVDPQSDVKTYGEKGKFSMDEVCTTAFDGECEVYKRFGLKRTVALRYVDGSGGDGSVDIYLSEFKDVPSAYGMFTKRVVADADPADPSAPRVLPLSGGAGGAGAGAIGTGRAYVWKGPHLVELQYNNEQESPSALAKSSESILTTISKEMAARLPGPGEVPFAAKALPVAQRIPNGVSFVLKEPLGIANLGQGAIGYYNDGQKRYRVVSLSREDADKAKDDVKVLKGRPGALPVAGAGDEAVVLVLQESKDRPKAEYLFARKGGVLLGVGDEEFAATGPTIEAAARYSKDEKLTKLKELLSAPVTATAPAVSASSASSAGRAASGSPQTDAGSGRAAASASASASAAASSGKHALPPASTK